MICKTCGANNADDAVFCTSCGASLAPAEESTTVLNETVEHNETVEQPVIDETPAEEAKDPGKVFGIISLILGIVGIVGGTTCSCFCSCLGGIAPAIMSVVGIILGVIGSKKSQEAGFQNKLAKVGLILSIVAIVIVIVFVILNAVLGGIMGATGAFDSGYYY